MLAVGVVFVPGLLIAGSFLLQNFFSLVATSHPFLYHSWWGWALVLGAALMIVSYVGIQISARVLLALTAIGVTMLLILDVVILAKGGAPVGPGPRSLRGAPTALASASSRSASALR